MANHTWTTIQLVAGLLLSLFFFSEDFLQALLRLKATLRQRPRLKYLAYPLGALFFLGAAALIVHALVVLATSRFSYD
jgi:hypothetical protein